MSNPIYLDIGNTNARWKFEGSFFESPILKFSFDELPKSSKIWVSNVSSNFVTKGKSNISFVESQTKYKSLVNSYKEPRNLGSDRWLAMIASYELSLGKGFIVVDIGSAITIDAVNKSGIHLGGLIFPGLDKLRQTFNNFPVLSTVDINEIGQTTENAWSIGTLSLVVNTINQKIKDLKIEIPNALIFLTGGGYFQINDFLEFDHFYYPNLVIDGLEFYVDNMG